MFFFLSFALWKMCCRHFIFSTLFIQNRGNIIWHSTGPYIRFINKNGCISCITNRHFTPNQSNTNQKSFILLEIILNDMRVPLKYRKFNVPLPVLFGNNTNSFIFCLIVLFEALKKLANIPLLYTLKIDVWIKSKLHTLNNSG